MTWKQALLESIEKWDKICFEGGGDNGSDDCALCTERWDRGGTCSKNCPIGMVTQRPYCYDTPYWKWDRLFKGDMPHIARGGLKSEACAIHEYLFLCMLYHEYYGDE